jgi:hypothetical protein
MKKRKPCHPNGNESMSLETLKPLFYLTGTPPIAMLTGDFRQEFETLKTLLLERFDGRDAAGPGPG